MDLLDDLEDLDGDEIVSYEQHNDNVMSLDAIDDGGESEEEDIAQDAEEADRLLLESIKRAEDVHTVAKLYGSKQLNDVLEVKKVFRQRSPNDIRPSTITRTM